ncbi:putative uncharacterized protein DDB_G0286901, partial [Sitodiplosis mosellana]|uniref:putative uncharacterized protein DDB_G0286901 n=1 Tax=Sitodiplosis mosellana TaxID=263140 RepID=UPI002444F3B1
MVEIDEAEYALKKGAFDRECDRVRPRKGTPIDIEKVKESTQSTSNDIEDDLQSNSSEESVDSQPDKLENNLTGKSTSETQTNSIDKSASVSNPGEIANNSENHTTSDNENENTMAKTPKDFIALANQMIGYRYNGDPLNLDSFLDAVDLLKELCERPNVDIMRKFVMTRLEGTAREAIVVEPQTVDDIIRQLKANIKTESSKVIEGRILALRADKSSLTKFAEQAEALAEQFRRSLCVEGFSKEKAKEMAVEKTVEMCRRSAKNDIVKAVIAASKFTEPKEVVAKMIVEINNVKQDKPHNSYTHKFGRPNHGNNNGRNFNNNDRSNKSQNNRQGNGGNWRSNGHNNGGNANNRGQNNNRSNQQGQNNNRNGQNYNSNYN